MTDAPTDAVRARRGASRRGATRRRAEAAAWILPSGGRVGLHRAISPAPLATRTAHVGLHGNPVSAGREYSRYVEGYLEDAEIVYVTLANRAVNLRPRQAAAITVEENVEIIGWARAAEIPSSSVDFSDIPSLASRHDEIVSGKVRKNCIVRELLR